MKLYYKGTDREVQKGDVLTDFRGDKAVAQREFDNGNITEKCYKAMMNYQVEITD